LDGEGGSALYMFLGAGTPLASLLPGGKDREMTEFTAPAALADSLEGPAEERLPLSTIAIWAAPCAGTGFMFFLTSMYLMKFSTDVLGIAPAAMGIIFLVSRVWDAVSDPISRDTSPTTPALGWAADARG
jgi:hypothetical protein